MATIAEILPRFWPGAEWTIREDDYETLQWADGNGVSKPSEADIRVRSEEVDVLINEEDKQARQQRAMADTPDYLLKALETLIEGMIEIRRVVNDIRTTAVPAAHTGSYTAWDNTVVSKISSLRQKITDLRNLN